MVSWHVTLGRCKTSEAIHYKLVMALAFVYIFAHKDSFFLFFFVCVFQLDSAQLQIESISSQCKIDFP